MQKGIKKVKWSRKKFITLSIVSLVIVSIGIGTFAVKKNNTSKATTASEKRTIQVTKGNIEVSITGSGTVTSSSTSDLMSNVDGKITKAYFSEGDEVKKGDLLYEIDDTDARLNIQKIENSISQAELNVSSNQKSYSNLTIKAPFSGKVSEVTAKAGESVNSNMSLFTLTETSKLTLSVPFSTTHISNIKIGQKAEVHAQEIMDTVVGVVTAIDNYTYTASNGGTVRDVEVTVVNPGRLTDEMTASVDISTSNGLESGSQLCKFEYANKQVVKASTAGSFSSVNIKDNQYVNKNDVLIQIENDDLQVTSKTNDLKMQDLNNQLVAAQKQLENYKVYSSIAGTITAIKFFEGDSVKSGNTLVSIRDFNQMQFTIPVDELDIAKIKVGQEAAITIDALTETTTKALSGEVIYKAREGTSSNGVAVYDVTVKINETENLLAGMNANASIILNKAENVLLLPLEAITKMGDKAFVRVIGASDNSEAQGQMGNRMPGGQNQSNTTESGIKQPNDNNTTNNNSNSGNTVNRSNRQNGTAANRQMSAGVAANQQYYASTTMKVVELGLNSDEYVEIKSGLAEGDIVVLPPLVTNSTSGNSTTTQGSGFSLGGIAGGGAAVGGMQPPSGGFTGNRQQSNTQNQRN